MRKVIIWGIGTFCKRILAKYPVPLECIETIVDQDINKQDQIFYGKKVESPRAIFEKEADTIVVGIDLRKYLKCMEEVSAFANIDRKEYKIIHLNEYVLQIGEETTCSQTIAPWAKEREKLLTLIEQIGPIRDEALKNVKVYSDREKILDYIPKGGTIAEVGVAYGDFTEKLLSKLNPDVFFAIDLFEMSDIWGRTLLQDSGLNLKQWYEKKFAEKIDSGKLKVCKGFSWEVLAGFPDRFFDYIYLDACHSYDSVSRDIEMCAKKIKEGGIIAFNDYTLYNFWTPPTDFSAYYGVVPAVNKLINESNSEVLYIGLEPALSNDVVIRYMC